MGIVDLTAHLTETVVRRYSVRKVNQAWRPATLLNSDFSTDVFSCEFCEIFKHSYFEQRLWKCGFFIMVKEYNRLQTKRTTSCRALSTTKGSFSESSNLFKCKDWLGIPEVWSGPTQISGMGSFGRVVHRFLDFSR